MEITLEFIVFVILALFIGVSAILAVTTKRILRAATYLLFVLFGTAGIYFQLTTRFSGPCSCWSTPAASRCSTSSRSC